MRRALVVVLAAIQISAVAAYAADRVHPLIMLSPPLTPEDRSTVRETATTFGQAIIQSIEDVVATLPPDIREQLKNYKPPPRVYVEPEPGTGTFGRPYPYPYGYGYGR